MAAQGHTLEPPSLHDVLGITWPAAVPNSKNLGAMPFAVLVTAIAATGAVQKNLSCDICTRRQSEGLPRLEQRVIPLHIKTNVRAALLLTLPQSNKLGRAKHHMNRYAR